MPCWSGYWGAVPLAIGVIALNLQVATGFLGWGIGAGGGYQARGVVDSGTGLSSRPATAIQSEGAAYWLQASFGVHDAALIALAQFGPPSSAQESICRARWGAQPCLTRPHGCFTQCRGGLAARCCARQCASVWRVQCCVVMPCVLVCGLWVFSMPLVSRCVG